MELGKIFWDKGGMGHTDAALQHKNGNSPWLCSFSFSGSLDFLSIQVGMEVYKKVSSLGPFVICES